jgi:Transcriptional regulator of heat shock gene
MNFWIIITVKEVNCYMSNKYVTLKTFYITVIFLCCFILLCLLTAVHLISLKEKELLDSLVMPVRTIQNNHADTPVKEEVQISDILYIVAEHNGRIGIFNPERTTVFEVLDVYVDYLPDTDRQYLKSGINIYSNDELLSVISDYTG